MSKWKWLCHDWKMVALIWEQILGFTKLGSTLAMIHHGLRAAWIKLRRKDNEPVS